MRDSTNILLSIIVPVYNVEPYIRACIESIFQQGLDEKDFEVIIVNDGTKDNSMEVIEDIINKHENITVITQENLGLSAARNKGLGIARGEYISFLDSDDAYITNTLKPLLYLAVQKMPDLLIADFVKLHDKDFDFCKYTQVNQTINNYKLLSGKDYWLNEHQHLLNCEVWFLLYKNSFLKNNNIYFVPGIFYEDIPFTNECYIKADRCIKVEWPFYLYRIREGSITNQLSVKKGTDFCTALSHTWELKKVIPKEKKDLHNTFQNMIYGHIKFLLFNISNSYLSIKEKKVLSSSIATLITKNKISFGNSINRKLSLLIIKHSTFSYILLRQLYYKIWQR